MLRGAMPARAIDRHRPPSPAARGAVTALVLLTALNLFNLLDRYILPGVQPLVQREFHIDDARIGFVTTAFLITYMLVAPLTGWLGDRYPRKPLIVIGAVIWSLATLLTAFVHSYATLLVRHAVVGVGEATFSIFAPALLADYYPEAERNRVLTVFYLTIPVGGALGYLAGGTLGARYGWRAPFFLSSFPGLLLAALLWRLIAEPERGSADTLAASFDRATLAGLRRNPAYWTATLGMAAWTFAVGGISVFLPTFFVRFGGYSVAGAGTVAGAITVIDGVAGTLAGGWIGQRWLRSNPRALYLISAWSPLLALPFAAAAFFGGRGWLLPCAFAAEFLLFLNTGPLNTAIINAVGAPIRATAIAVELFVIHALGDALSPVLIGHVSDLSNLRLGLSITLVALAISAAILFAGARYAPPVAPTA